MPNAVRKMAEYLGLYEGKESIEDFADDTYVPEMQYTRPVAVPATPHFPASAPVASVAAPAMPSAMPQGRPNAIPSPRLGEVYRITTIHPRSYNDARRIGEDFRSGTPVIMNLSDMDDADSRRIVDFSAGLAFGLHGSIERITKGVYLLSPSNVDLGAAARAQLREDPFFNQS